MSEDTSISLPEHIGIIMDGNGRWAQKRHMARTAGHREGLTTAKKIVSHASSIGIRYITLYTFSTENWKRAEDEVSFLMGLISRHLKKEMQFYISNGIRVVHSGDLSGLPKAIQAEINDVSEKTSDFKGLVVNLAINYGGRDEIIRSIRRIMSEDPKAQISEDSLRRHMDQPDIPDPDLIIRTAGEYRISNFLLWQCAYSEMFVSEKYWPDFKEKDLDKAIQSYMKRDRKYGGVL